MKTYAATALAGALTLGVPAMAQEVEITFAHFLANASTEAPNVADAIARFRDKYPDVTLDEQISGTDEYLTQFNVGAASGEVPDVFMMNGSDTTGLVAAGLVGPITEEFRGLDPVEPHRAARRVSDDLLRLQVELHGLEPPSGLVAAGEESVR